jgi:AcrR family transcriptional regulator
MARTRAHDYDAKRLAILHRSAELFAQLGYYGTSISMIAEACGVSKALLYHYYSDKEAVLFDILYAHFGDLIAAVEEAERSERDPKERVYAIAAALLEAYRDAGAEHQVQISNLKLLPSDQQEQLKNMERTIVSVLSGAVAEALPSVGRGPLLKPLTMSIFGMLNWHYLWFREGKGLTRSDYARLITRLVIAGAAEAATGLTLPGTFPKRDKAKARIAVRRSVRRRRGVRSAAG